jgi:hypothetical protein
MNWSAKDMNDNFGPQGTTNNNKKKNHHKMFPFAIKAVWWFFILFFEVMLNENHFRFMSDYTAQRKTGHILSAD